MENKSGIYWIRNLVNNKIYVGSAVCFKTRWGRHKYDLNNNLNRPNNRRKVKQLDLDGNLIKVWDYVTKAAKELGVAQSNISQCLTGRIKTCAGFIWRYTE